MISLFIYFIHFYICREISFLFLNENILREWTFNNQRDEGTQTNQK